MENLCASSDLLSYLLAQPKVIGLEVALYTVGWALLQTPLQANLMAATLPLTFLLSKCEMFQV